MVWTPTGVHTTWPYATCLIQYTFTQCTIHTPYRSQYAAIALTTPRTSFTQILLTKRVIFSQALTLTPWRWFLCKPKHVGAFLSNLECFNNSAFLTLCASVGNKRGFSIADARCNHEVYRKTCLSIIRHKRFNSRNVTSLTYCIDVLYAAGYHCNFVIENCVIGYVWM